MTTIAHRVVTVVRRVVVDVRVPRQQAVQQHRSLGGRDTIHRHAPERKPAGGIRAGRLRAPVPEPSAVRLDISRVVAAQTLTGRG